MKKDQYWMLTISYRETKGGTIWHADSFTNTTPMEAITELRKTRLEVLLLNHLRITKAEYEKAIKDPSGNPG